MALEERLGELTGLLRGMQASIDEKHIQNRDWQERHDDHDQKNFREVFSRLRSIENRNALADERANREKEQLAVEGPRRHNWQMNLFMGACIMLAAIIGPIIALKLQHGLGL